MLTDTTKSPFAKVTGISLADVDWTGGLYKERFDRIAGVTVGHLQKMFENPDISHVLENFRIAAGDAQGEFAGTVFGDGDFYKWMESAALTAVKTDNSELSEKLEEYIALFARAQQEDGYLSTKQIIGERQGKGAMRQGNINDFEVYNMGHLFTSACLYRRMTGCNNFLAVAERAAGYLKNMYEEAEAKGEVKTAVCPSHYMGLIELYRTTGKREYLELAGLAVKLRDSVKNGLDDNQDRIPLKTHRKIVGHAVRSNYLYAGLADLCLETGDEDYREVLRSVWKDLTTKKIYITGGCGALYNGASPYGNFMHHQLVHQAYGYEYQLPNVTAYNETCANLGLLFWAWRMFALEPKAEYMDMAERVMLNAGFAGISLDGKRFFYENMLRRAKKLDYELIWGQERSEYILSYCCPPNLARTIAETAGYAYAKDAEGVWTGLYGDSRAKLSLENGAKFTLRQETDYPWEGEIRFTVEEGNGLPFTLHVRIPGWTRSGSLSVKGGRILRPEDEGPEAYRSGDPRWEAMESGGFIAGETPAETEECRPGEGPRRTGVCTAEEGLKPAGICTAEEGLKPAGICTAEEGLKMAGICTAEEGPKRTGSCTAEEEPDEVMSLDRSVAGTYLAVRVEDPEKACIRLMLGMEPRLVRANSLVEEARGQAAVERGPLVYCLESADAAVDGLDELLMPVQPDLKPVDLEICGCRMKALEGRMYRVRLREKNALYADLEAESPEEVPVRMIPYFAWDNRGFGEMIVWLPVVRRI